MILVNQITNTASGWRPPGLTVVHSRRMVKTGRITPRPAIKGQGYALAGMDSTSGQAVTDVAHTCC